MPTSGPVRIPFVDLGRLHRTIYSELREAIERCIDTSTFVGGTPVRDFELAFAAMHGHEDAVACNSGTDALMLALEALGVGPGDEVIVPALTFVATAEAVVRVGATPVLADVDRETLLLSPEAVESVRTEKTRAVIPVHLYGHVVPFEHLRTWKSEGLLVIEDAAQAHLAEENGVRVGSVGHATCFSFYPGKNLGALGDGGMVLFDDGEPREKARMLRDHGSREKFVHLEPGHCSRLDSIQAAVLSVKLRHLDEWTNARRRAAESYSSRLSGRLVPWREGDVHHLLVVRTPERDRVRRRLAEQGVETGIHYPVALSGQPWLRRFAGTCPSAELAAAEVLSLPMHASITDDEVAAVCDALEHAWRGLGIEPLA